MTDERIVALEKRVTALEQLLAGDTATAAVKRQSMREVFQQKQPQNYVDKTVVVIGEMEARGQGSVSLDEVRAGYREAKEPLPANLSDQIYKATKRGLLMSAEDKDGLSSWVLTATGEEYLAAMGEKQ